MSSFGWMLLMKELGKISEKYFSQLQELERTDALQMKELT